MLPCGHKKGTLKDTLGGVEVEYCSVCNQVTDMEAWAQGIANMMDAPVFGQLVDLGTIEPKEDK